MHWVSLQFDSNEAEKLLEIAEKWQHDLITRFPKREFKTTVVDINGKSVFITRYFKALKPPEDLLSGEESTLEKSVSAQTGSFRNFSASFFCTLLHRKWWLDMCPWFHLCPIQ